MESLSSIFSAKVLSPGKSSLRCTSCQTIFQSAQVFTERSSLGTPASLRLLAYGCFHPISSFLVISRTCCDQEEVLGEIEDVETRIAKSPFGPRPGPVAKSGSSHAAMLSQNFPLPTELIGLKVAQML